MAVQRNISRHTDAIAVWSSLCLVTNQIYYITRDLRKDIIKHEMVPLLASFPKRAIRQNSALDGFLWYCCTEPWAMRERFARSDSRIRTTCRPCSEVWFNPQGLSLVAISIRFNGISARRPDGHA